MIRNLFIHIGQFKTGSSSLQATFYFHRNYLKRSGILYPEELENWHNHLYFSGNYTRMFPLWLEKKITEEEFFEKAEKSKNHILAQLAEQDYEKAIISSEEFCHFNDKSKLTELFSDLREIAKNIKIIIYLRHQMSHIDSAYKQRVLSRTETRSFNAFFKEKMSKEDIEFDYKKILIEYAKIFGKENIIVRNFDSEHLIKTDVVSDFNKLLNIYMAYSENTKNISPSAQNTEFFRITQSANSLDTISKQRITRVLRRKKMKNISGAKYFYNEKQIKEVEDKFSEDNKFISKEFHFPILKLKKLEETEPFFEASTAHTDKVAKFLSETLDAKNF